MEDQKKKPRKYRTYTEEYRSEAVRLAQESGSVEQTAKSLGMSFYTLSSWIRRAKSLSKKALVKNSSGQNMLDLEAEVKRLSKELDRMERTNKVLKVAAAFFCQDQLENDMRKLKK